MLFKKNIFTRKRNVFSIFWYCGGLIKKDFKISELKEILIEGFEESYEIIAK